MKIRRSIIVLLVMATLLVPVALYRSMFSADASEELVSAVNIIFKVLMAIFLLLNFSFSIFTDDFPHSYNETKNPILGIFSVLVAVALGYVSALGLINSELAVYSGITGKVFSVLGVLSVLAFMFYAITCFKGENIVTSAALVPIFPALWYGFRLLLNFLESASMADISHQLLLIAITCAFTIFSLTLGKLFSCANSYSVKWAFVSGSVGILCTLIYISENLMNIMNDMSQLVSSPLIIIDIAMSLFALAALFHISVPAKYFDDEEWDDYFYETYDLPKPTLITHTPVDELQEDVYTGDEVDNVPYIPATASINSVGNDAYSPAQPVIPSYIANPASYNPATMPLYPQYPASGYPQAYPPPVQQPYYPQYPASGYPQAYPPPVQQPYYPQYPQSGYPQAYQPPIQQPNYPTDAYADPYNAAAIQYQYERRRAELQNRELEQLTGQVESSLSQIDNSVRSMQMPSNQYVAASPDEVQRERRQIAPAQKLKPISSNMQSGESLTDHLDRINREAQRPSQSNSIPEELDDEYTYEYYYPNGTQMNYSPNQFNPYQRNNGNKKQ